MEPVKPKLKPSGADHFLHYIFNGRKCEKKRLAKFAVVSRNLMRAALHLKFPESDEDDADCVGRLHINAITYSTHLSIYFGNFWIDKECPDAHIAAVWARLMHPTALHLRSYTQDRSRDMQRSYAELCKTLREVNTLQKIILHLDNAHSIENQTLIDGLPLVPIDYSGCVDGPMLLSLNGRRPPMPTVELNIDNDWGRLLSANVEKLKLIEHPYANESITSLSEIPDYFPLKPNPGLKHLEMFTPMLTPIYDWKDEDSTEVKAADIRWHTQTLPRYREALRLLNDWNPDLKMVVTDSNSWIRGITSVKDVLARLNGYFRNVQTFCDLFAELNIELVSFAAEGTIFIKEMAYHNSRWVDKLCEILHQHYPHLEYGCGIGVSDLKGEIPNSVIRVNIDFMLNSRAGESAPSSPEWNEPEYKPPQSNVPSFFDDDFDWGNMFMEDDDDDEN